MAVGDNACEASGFSLAAQENDHVTRLWEFSAGELADLIRTRQASCLEVVDAHLERIWSVNPRVNALTNVMTDQAREAAQEADRRTMSGDSLGPLHGIPFTVKENIDVAGTATTWGVSALQDAIVHAPPTQAADAFWNEHTLPHVPQLLTLVLVLISHPSAALLLQLLNPALHEI